MSDSSKRKEHLSWIVGNGGSGDRDPVSHIDNNTALLLYEDYVVFAQLERNSTKEEI